MTEKTILTDIEKLNHIGRCEEIDIVKENKLLREITANLKKTIRKQGLTALSAPAIGYNKRVFCIDFSDKEIKTFINPVISYSDGIEMAREVCSSLPGKQYIRPRNTSVDVYYQTPTGQIKNNRFKGLASFVIQHEIDHLEGVLLEDIGLEVEEDFDNASEEERIDIINMYLESLDLKREQLEKDINEDEELKIISDRYKFEEALASGKIKLEKLEEEK